MADSRTAEIREENVSLGESMGDMKSTRFCRRCLTLPQSSNVNLIESLFFPLEMWSSVNLIPHAVFGADGEKKKEAIVWKSCSDSSAEISVLSSLASFQLHSDHLCVSGRRTSHGQLRPVTPLHSCFGRPRGPFGRFDADTCYWARLYWGMCMSCRW